MKIVNRMSFLKEQKSRYINVEMMILAILVGIITGGISIVFNKGLFFYSDLMFRYLPSMGDISAERMFLTAPLLGGVLVGLINRYLMGVDRGFGVREVMDELEDIDTFRIKPVAVLIKTLGAIVTLGSGLSAGRHGPIVFLGGAVGSSIGYGFKYSSRTIPVLIGCGVAGSMAGVFNIPMAATLFVLEVIMINKHYEYFVPVLTSSVTATIITKCFSHSSVFLNIKGDFGFHFVELLYYIPQGIFLGLVAVFYILTLKKVKVLFKKINLNIVLAPVVGAFIVVLIGHGLPLIYDLYYESILVIIEQSLSIKLLLLLLVGKTMATAVTLGSGGIGGVFMPGLLIGTLAGGIYGQLLANIFQLQIYNVDTYTLLGIGGIFAGFANAPITAVLLVVELTQNYMIIPPLLIVAFISSKTAKSIYWENIYSVSTQKIKNKSTNFD